MPQGVYYRSPEYLKEMAKRLPHGHKHTEESRKKLSLAHKGKKLSLEHRKKISLNQTGKKRGPRTLEHRIKMSLMMRGENGPNWQGGLTEKNKALRRSLEFRLWREAVFTRDNWTCQDCKLRGGELHPHHIKPFALFEELRFAIDNGITLCADCHKKTESYGKNARFQ